MALHVHRSVDVVQSVETVVQVLGAQGPALTPSTAGKRQALRFEIADMVPGLVTSPPYGRIVRTLSVERLPRGSRIHWDSTAELAGEKQLCLRLMRAEGHQASATLRRVKRKLARHHHVVDGGGAKYVQRPSSPGFLDL
jgi:hypothetical protein